MPLLQVQCDIDHIGYNQMTVEDLLYVLRVTLKVTLTCEIKKTMQAMKIFSCLVFISVRATKNFQLSGRKTQANLKKKDLKRSTVQLDNEK